MQAVVVRIVSKDGKLTLLNRPLQKLHPTIEFNSEGEGQDFSLAFVAHGSQEN